MKARRGAFLSAEAVQAVTSYAGVEPLLEISAKGQRGPRALRFPLEVLERLRAVPALDRYFGEASLPPPWVVDALTRGAAISGGTKNAKGSTVEAQLEESLRGLPGVRDQLRESQLEAIRFALARDGRALIAHEMGLGKTLTALVIAQRFAEEWPLLVVAPKGVMLNWGREVRKWFPHLERDVQVLGGFEKDPDPSKHIIVASYDQVSRVKSLQVRPDGNPWKVVIADEAHYIKTPDTIRTRRMLPICQQAQRCLLLSGTPVMNCAAETWSLLAALIPEHTGSFEDFCGRYSIVEEFQGRVRHTGVRHAEELHLLMSSLMVRHRKRDALPDLQKKQRIKKIIKLDELGASDRKKIGQVRNRIGRWRGGNIAAVQLYSITAKAKAKVVPDYVCSVLQREDKVVVFAHHHVLLDAVQQRMEAIGEKFVRVDGQVEQKRRDQLVESFQTDPSVRVAIMAITAAGQGISLTAARVAIFAELHWVPGKLLQAEDRVHRAGQNRSVEIHYVVIEGDAFSDMRLLNTLEAKDSIVGGIVDGYDKNGALNSGLSPSTMLSGKANSKAKNP